MKRTLVILSGGMDSTVLAYHLAQDSKTDLVGAVSVDYGQKHRRELQCAEQTCRILGIPFRLVDLSSLAGILSNSALTSGMPVPEGHYEAESMKATVVPNRNMILIALALGVAINDKADSVAYGAHAGDHAIYPDCREEFAQAMNQVAGLCDYQPLELLRPFIKMSKADIVRRGVKLRVPFELTHTCYNGNQKACGKCGTCVERLEAFAEALAIDPLEYEDKSFWMEAVSNRKRPAPAPEPSKETLAGGK